MTTTVVLKLRLHRMVEEDGCLLLFIAVLVSRVASLLPHRRVIVDDDDDVMMCRGNREPSYAKNT